MTLTISLELRYNSNQHSKVERWMLDVNIDRAKNRRFPFSTFTPTGNLPKMILNQGSMNVNLAAPGLFYVHMLLSHMLRMDVEKKF